MSSDWRPLYARESAAPAEFDGPYEGVPDWLFPGLWAWCEDQIPPIWTGRTYSEEVISAWRNMGLALHIAVPDPYGEQGHNLPRTWHKHVQAAPDDLLSVADYILAHIVRGRDTRAPAHAAELGRILATGGSAWEVRTDRDAWYLSRRVGGEARAAADSIMAGADRAAEYLRAAWRAVYGRSPHPGDGYRDAIKAVEVAAIPVVSPLNTRATLGTVIADLRAAPDKWRIGLHHPDPDAQVRALADTLDLLWKGDLRHGTADPATPVTLTLEEA